MKYKQETFHWNGLTADFCVRERERERERLLSLLCWHAGISCNLYIRLTLALTLPCGDQQKRQILKSKTLARRMHGIAWEIIIIYFKKNINILIFLAMWLVINIPTIPSSIWYSPSPGHSPRFDPKKLRAATKLNLSTEVFLTLTSSLKTKLNMENSAHLVVVPSSTVATVLKHGSRQSETFKPENKSSEKSLL